MKKSNSKMFMILAAVTVILLAASTFLNNYIKNVSSDENQLVVIEPLKHENIKIKEGTLRVDYFFWLKCGGCYSIEPIIGEWYLSANENIDFNFVPVGWPNALADSEYFYIVKKIFEDGQLSKESFVNVIKDIFYITFEDSKPLNYKNVYSKLEKHKIFKDYSGFENYISDNKSYIASGIKYSEEITRMYGVGSVPSIVLDKSKLTTVGDYNNNPKTMINKIESIANEKSERKK